MDTLDSIKIRHSLPEHYYRQAAGVLYDAFRQKFEPILGSRERSIVLLVATFAPEMAFVALYEGQFAGVAALKYEGRSLYAFTLPAFAREYGWLRGPFKLALFALADSRPARGEFMLDSIAVAPTMRGKGVGTQLIQAVAAYALELGFDALYLEVVDTNPRAQRLYEQLGFVATETKTYPFLRNIMGFSAVVKMVKKLNSPGTGRRTRDHTEK